MQIHDAALIACWSIIRTRRKELISIGMTMLNMIMIYNVLANFWTSLIEVTIKGVFFYWNLLSKLSYFFMELWGWWNGEILCTQILYKDIFWSTLKSTLVKNRIYILRKGGIFQTKTCWEHLTLFRIAILFAFVKGSYLRLNIWRAILVRPKLSKKIWNFTSVGRSWIFFESSYTPEN